MKVSILDLGRNLSYIVKALDRNESVTLTCHGRTKATIIPAKNKTAVDLQKHSALGMWADRDIKALEDQIDRKAAKNTRRRKTSIPRKKAKKQLGI